MLMYLTVERQDEKQDFRALIQRPGEKAFQARIVERVYYYSDANEVDEWRAEGCIYDNDGSLVPLSQVDGVIAVMDPGEKIADVMQPRKQARRKGLLRALKYVGQAVKVFI